MKKGLYTTIAILTIVFLWHLFASAQISSKVAEEAESDVNVSVNRITNVVTVTFYESPGDDWGADFAIGMMQMIGASPMERALKQAARSHFDLYAMLIPYTVSIQTAPATEEQMAIYEQRQRDRETQREQERLAREAERQAAKDERLQSENEERKQRMNYAHQYMAIEDGRVAVGERFGRPTQGVFGTLVNGGDRDLSRVKIIVYFLGEDGRRIGEKEYNPVWSDNIMMSTSPLRTGYRHDFGYSVDDHAPSGWSEEVEIQITDIYFADD